MPKVLNRNQGMPAGAVYVGRPTKWGNPFLIGVDGNRTQVISQYEEYLKQSPLMNQLSELRGKDLVCWCAPKKCHADVLLKLANGGRFF